MNKNELVKNLKILYNYALKGPNDLLSNRDMVLVAGLIKKIKKQILNLQDLKILKLKQVQEMNAKIELLNFNDVSAVVIIQKLINSLK
jgi:hypothetical protein